MIVISQSNKSVESHDEAIFWTYASLYSLLEYDDRAVFAMYVRPLSNSDVGTTRATQLLMGAYPLSCMHTGPKRVTSSYTIAHLVYRWLAVDRGHPEIKRKSKSERERGQE